MEYLVILDIDQTLVEYVSWTQLTTALGADATFHLELYSKMKKGEITLQDAKKELIRIWRDSKNANKKFIQAIFQNTKLREGTEEVISYLKKEEMRILLLSGSMDLFVGKVANLLSVENYLYNTRLIFNEEEELVDFEYEIDQSTFKLRQLEKFLKDNFTQNPIIISVGDGDNDQKIFDVSDYSIQIISEQNLLNIHSDYKANNLIELISIFKSIKND